MPLLVATDYRKRTTSTPILSLGVWAQPEWLKAVGAVAVVGVRAKMGAARWRAAAGAGAALLAAALGTIYKHSRLTPIRLRRQHVAATNGERRTGPFGFCVVCLVLVCRKCTRRQHPVRSVDQGRSATFFCYDWRRVPRAIWGPSMVPCPSNSCFFAIFCPNGKTAKGRKREASVEDAFFSCAAKSCRSVLVGFICPCSAHVAWKLDRWRRVPVSVTGIRPFCFCRRRHILRINSRFVRLCTFFPSRMDHGSSCSAPPSTFVTVRAGSTHTPTSRKKSGQMQLLETSTRPSKASVFFFPR